MLDFGKHQFGWLEVDVKKPGPYKIVWGELLDEKGCLEGMVTVCIRCMSVDGKHYFRTQTDGLDISKSPEDMFPAVEIDNDLKFVDTKIREYYEYSV